MLPAVRSTSLHLGELGFLLHEIAFCNDLGIELFSCIRSFNFVSSFQVVPAENFPAVI